MKAGEVEERLALREQQAAEDAKSPFHPKSQHSSSRRTSASRITFTFPVSSVNNHPHKIVMTHS